MNTKEISIRSSQISQRFIHFLNERPAKELRTMDVVDKVSVVMDISKVVFKEEAKARE